MTTTCSECGATKPDGIDALIDRWATSPFPAGAYRLGRVEMENAGIRQLAEMASAYGAEQARAPLEAKVRELEARVECMQGNLENTVCDDADKAKRITELEAQLAQAQKPAEAKGLPAVGEPVEVNPGATGSWVKDFVMEHTTWTGQPAFRPMNRAMILMLMHEGQSWRRIPAQTIREPAADKPKCRFCSSSEYGCDSVYCNCPGSNHGVIADAPPPTDAPDGVTTENVATWYAEDSQYTYTQLQEAATRDIRANLAREGKRSAERIAELENALERVRQERERVRRDLVGQRDDLRAKLEAAEHANATQQHAIRELEGRLASRDMEIAEMSAVHERRQPVDRERAIAEVKRLLNGFGVGLRERDFDRIATAILGAAKAEVLRTRRVVGERQACVRELESTTNTLRMDLEAIANTVGLDRSAGVVEIVRRCVGLRAEVERLTRDLERAKHALEHVKDVREKTVWEKIGEDKRAELEELCIYINETCQGEPEFCIGVGPAGIALALLKRLKAAAYRRCPADGMSPREIGHTIKQAIWPESGGFDGYEAGGDKARELFMPVADKPAEKRAPKVGDKIWSNCLNDDGRAPATTCRCNPFEAEVYKVEGGKFWVGIYSTPRYIEDEGKTWWWDKPSAKGAE